MTNELAKVFIGLGTKFSSMKRTIPLIFMVMAVIFLSSCINTPPQEHQKTRQVPATTECTPDYVSIGVLENSNQLSDTMAKGKCKTTCFDKYRLTSYKVRLITTDIPMVEEDSKSYLCSCDTNDCGGSELVKTTRSS